MIPSRRRWLADLPGADRAAWTVALLLAAWASALAGPPGSRLPAPAGPPGGAADSPRPAPSREARRETLLGRLLGRWRQLEREREEWLGDLPRPAEGAPESDSNREDGDLPLPFAEPLDALEEEACREPGHEAVLAELLEARSLPAEFETPGVLVLGCHEFVQAFPDVIGRLIAAVAPRIPVIALVRDEDDEKVLEEILRDHRVDPDRVRLARIPHDTLWIRDYGPLAVRVAGGGVEILDAGYTSEERLADDRVPAALARRLGLPARQLPVRLDGGNLVTNGEGLCLTTTQVLEENADLELGRDDLREILDLYCGCRTTVFLEPLAGEETGHVDMFTTFVSRRDVVVGRYDPGEDPANAIRLERNAERLRQVVTRGGALRVHRIPMPPRDGGIWRTYTNVLFARGLLLVPVYPEADPEGLEAALSLYRRLLPGWSVTALDAELLAERGGALRCASVTLPPLD